MDVHYHLSYLLATMKRCVSCVDAERQVIVMLYLIGIGMFCLTIIALVAMCLGKDFKSDFTSEKIKHRLDIKDKK